MSLTFCLACQENYLGEVRGKRWFEESLRGRITARQCVCCEFVGLPISCLCALGAVIIRVSA